MHAGGAQHPQVPYPALFPTHDSGILLDPSCPMESSGQKLQNYHSPFSHALTHAHLHTFILEATVSSQTLQGEDRLVTVSSFSQSRVTCLPPSISAPPPPNYRRVPGAALMNLTASMWRCCQWWPSRSCPSSLPWLLASPASISRALKSIWCGPVGSSSL